MNTSGFFIIAIGLLILFIAVTGKYECFSQFISCLFTVSGPAQASSGGGASGFVSGLAGGILGSGNPFGGILGDVFGSGGGNTGVKDPLKDLGPFAS